jgi:hypothetical protein
MHLIDTALGRARTAKMLLLTGVKRSSKADILKGSKNEWFVNA